MFKWHDIGMAVKLQCLAWIMSKCKRKTEAAKYLKTDGLLWDYYHTLSKVGHHSQQPLTAPLLTDEQTVWLYKTKRVFSQATTLDVPLKWLPAAADNIRIADPSSSFPPQVSTLHTCSLSKAKESQREGGGGHWYLGVNKDKRNSTFRPSVSLGPLDHFSALWADACITWQQTCKFVKKIKMKKLLVFAPGAAKAATMSLISFPSGCGGFMCFELFQKQNTMWKTCTITMFVSEC